MRALARGEGPDARPESHPPPRRTAMCGASCRLASSESPDGDIKFEVFGDGAKHESGYIAIFGGWQNRLNIIARLEGRREKTRPSQVS